MSDGVRAQKKVKQEKLQIIVTLDLVGKKGKEILYICLSDNEITLGTPAMDLYHFLKANIPTISKPRDYGIV